MKKFLVLIFAVFLSLPQLGLAQDLDHLGNTFGGEVPWPLSSQRVVTVENTSGLWQLTHKGQKRIFNVEMIAHKGGKDWIRVSELSLPNYDVISWGEGFFEHLKQPQTGSSYSSIAFGSTPTNGDNLGRYIYMFPNGNIFEQPYIVRLVEVDTSVGSVLGLSVIHLLDMDFQHMLGRRLLKDPLECLQQKSEGEHLRCHIRGLD